MSLNYVKVFADGTSEATLVKPAYGIYDREFAGDNRDTYHNGKWHPVIGGEELVTNGDASLPLAGEWVDGASSTVSIENNMIKVVTTAAAAAEVYQEITGLTVGKVYKLAVGALTSNINTRVYVTSQGGSLADLGSLTAPNTSLVFTATTSTVRIHPVSNDANVIHYADNISLYELEPTLGTPYLTQFTYLSKDGKLAEIEVADGQPVDIHFDKLAPTLVEDTIQANNLVVTDSFDLGQTWQDVTASRSVGVTYTNTTGKPIVARAAISDNGGLDVRAYVDDVEVDNHYDGNGGVVRVTNLTMKVPNGSTYKIKLINGGYSLQNWSELR